MDDLNKPIKGGCPPEIRTHCHLPLPRFNRYVTILPLTAGLLLLSGGSVASAQNSPPPAVVERMLQKSGFRIIDVTRIYDDTFKKTIAKAGLVFVDGSEIEDVGCRTVRYQGKGEKVRPNMNRSQNSFRG